MNSGDSSDDAPSSSLRPAVLRRQESEARAKKHVAGWAQLQLRLFRGLQQLDTLFPYTRPSGASPTKDKRQIARPSRGQQRGEAVDEDEAAAGGLTLRAVLVLLYSMGLDLSHAGVLHGLTVLFVTKQMVRIPDTQKSSTRWQWCVRDTISFDEFCAFMSAVERARSSAGEVDKEIWQQPRTRRKFGRGLFSVAATSARSATHSTSRILELAASHGRADSNPADGAETPAVPHGDSLLYRAFAGKLAVTRFPVFCTALEHLYERVRAVPIPGVALDNVDMYGYSNTQKGSATPPAPAPLAAASDIPPLSNEPLQFRDQTAPLRCSPHIPALSSVPGHLFSVSVCTVDGQIFSVGDSHIPLTLQGMHKPFTYALALEEWGPQRVHEHIGTEPYLADAFRLVREGGRSKALNPMTNGGSMVASALIQPHAPYSERCKYVQDTFAEIAGVPKLGFANQVYLGEVEHSSLNRAIVHYMTAAGVFQGVAQQLEVEKLKYKQEQERDLSPRPGGLDAILELDNNAAFAEPAEDMSSAAATVQYKLKYSRMDMDALDMHLQSCSIEATTPQLATMAANLANRGKCPHKGTQVLSATTVVHVLQSMFSAGLYGFSGEWAMSVGLPAVSSASGGILVVVPDVMGIAIYSPLLDSTGNSARAVLFASHFVRQFGMGLFDQILHRPSPFRFIASASEGNSGAGSVKTKTDHKPSDQKDIVTMKMQRGIGNAAFDGISSEKTAPVLSQGLRKRSPSRTPPHAGGLVEDGSELGGAARPAPFGAKKGIPGRLNSDPSHIGVNARRLSLLLSHDQVLGYPPQDSAAESPAAMEEQKQRKPADEQKWKDLDNSTHQIEVRVLAPVVEDDSQDENALAEHRQAVAELKRELRLFRRHIKSGILPEITDLPETVEQVHSVLQAVANDAILHDSKVGDFCYPVRMQRALKEAALARRVRSQNRRKRVEAKQQVGQNKPTTAAAAATAAVVEDDQRSATQQHLAPEPGAADEKVDWKPMRTPMQLLRRGSFMLPSPQFLLTHVDSQLPGDAMTAAAAAATAAAAAAAAADGSSDASSTGRATLPGVRGRVAGLPAIDPSSSPQLGALHALKDIYDADTPSHASDDYHELPRPRSFSQNMDKQDE